MGLDAALGIAGRALEVFSTGIQVAGQNIANANTPGYIQENLQVSPSASYGVSPLILGTGVTAVSVTQQVNQYLQEQILTANSAYNSSNTLSTVYTNLQQQLQALGSGGLSTQIGNFVDAINNLTDQPESVANRQLAVDAGTQLTSSITSLRNAVDTQISQENVNVSQLTDQANKLIQNIAQINPEIAQTESNGLTASQDGSLLDQRYQDLNQLSQIMPVTYTNNTDGSISVYSGSNFLVLGDQYQQLQSVPSVTAGVSAPNVQLSITGQQITANSGGGGELVGVLQGRDQILGGFVQNLDQVTSNLISQFNQVYASGQGLEGFTSTTSTNAVSDPTASLANSGLAFTPQTGNFQVLVTNTLTGQTATSTINVNLGGTGSDTTLNSLAASLNGVGNISANVTPDGHLQLNADPNYQIQFANDTSNVLSSLGINTFFTGSNSGDIDVNSAVANDPSLFAAAQGGGPADGSNALALTQFASNAVDGLNGSSITDYYNSVVSNIANNASAESTLASSQQDFSNSLQSQQQQYSGVSLDEEAIQIMQYQQSYQASARLISTIDQLYQALLQV